MALTDADVQKQINHMISFIEQEAKDKVNEINSRADEEFEIEKSRIVQDKRSKLEEHFTKEEKKLEQRKKIQHANLMNQARLKILSCRQQNIRNVLEEARQRLFDMTKNPQKYEEMMKGLILQGLFQLLEKDVMIRCRKEDNQMVERILQGCILQYETKTKSTVKVTIDTNNPLSSNIPGGVELMVPNGRIKVVNTLESRLALMSSQLIPEMREILFGINSNRKFRD